MCRVSSFEARATRQPPAGSVSQPVLELEIGDPRELLLVIGDESASEREGLGRDQQIVGADHPAGPFEPGTHPP